MDTSEVTERGTVNPVKRQRKKKPHSTVASSRIRIVRFLEKKSAGKPDSASPEDNQSITAVPRLREQESESALSEKPKELKNTSPTCGRKKDCLWKTRNKSKFQILILTSRQSSKNS